MVCLCWLLVVVWIYVCVPGSGSVCWDSSICTNLSNKERILGCVHLCLSVIHTEIPELRVLTLKVSDDVSDDLLLSVILGPLTSEDDSSLTIHKDARRAYSMEHFRWGKPLGFRLGPKLRSHIDHRRSYSMEHFRWGKPYGRKRRPVKVFTSALEGGGSPEGLFPAQVRWQRSRREDNPTRDITAREPKQGSVKAAVNSRPLGLLSLQKGRDQNYRMNHFRWGSPPSSKRDIMLRKAWEEKQQRQLGRIFRNIIVKDVQRIVDRMDG